MRSLFPVLDTKRPPDFNTDLTQTLAWWEGRFVKSVLNFWVRFGTICDPFRPGWSTAWDQNRFYHDRICLRHHLAQVSSRFVRWGLLLGPLGSDCVEFGWRLVPLGGCCRAVPGNMATRAPPLKEGALSEWLNVLFECSLLCFSGALSAVSDWRVMEGSWRVAACVLGCACRRFSGEWDFHSIHDHADSGIVVAQK